MLPEVVEAVLLEMRPPSCESAPWRVMSEQELWCELVACVLGSAVRFEDAVCAIRRLKKAGALTLNRKGVREKRVARKVEEVLKEKCQRRGCCSRRYRFPRKRAELVGKAAATVYANGRSLGQLLSAVQEARLAREVLVLKVPGIGRKQ